MNRKLLTILIAIVVIGLCGLSVWKYVNQPTHDYKATKAEQHFDMKEIAAKADKGDTLFLKSLIGKVLEVSGVIHSMSADSASITIEMTDSTSNTSLVCQADKRHLEDFYNLNLSMRQTIKGYFTGFNEDLDLGLGNTLQMSYCSLDRKPH